MDSLTRPVRRRARRLLQIAVRAVLPALLFAALNAGAARADGDPASDMLMAQNVFYPYRVEVPQTLQRRLDGAVSAAHRAHLPLKVALIAHPADLGAITALYGSPQRYARFLDIELSFNGKVPLLVVMNHGFGSEGLPSKLEHTVTGARPPATTTGAGLVAAALSLVDRLDTELGTGHVGRASTGSNSKSKTRTLLLLGLILAALLVGGLLIIARAFFPPNAKLRNRS